jgi:hypothetical protein
MVPSTISARLIETARRKTKRTEEVRRGAV